MRGGDRNQEVPDSTKPTKMFQRWSADRNIDLEEKEKARRVCLDPQDRRCPRWGQSARHLYLQCHS